MTSVIFRMKILSDRKGLLRSFDDPAGGIEYFILRCETAKAKPQGCFAVIAGQPDGPQHM